jgi:predicted HAD superfamily Cof-like phosphohydrolase
MDSNFQYVKTWMGEVGQEIPKCLVNPGQDIMNLRRKLIVEECAELVEVFKTIEDDEDQDPYNLVDAVKELCDILVVTYGAMVALGVDGDAAFRLVMENNDGKIAHRITREDGKIIVPQDIKDNLKMKMYENLSKLLKIMDVAA